MAAEFVLTLNVEYIGLCTKEENPTGLADRHEVARTAKPDRMITSFWFVEGEHEVCRRMIKEGIPIIGYDMEDIRPNRIPYIGFVGLDIRRAGEVAARATLNNWTLANSYIRGSPPGRYDENIIPCANTRRRPQMDYTTPPPLLSSPLASPESTEALTA